jgi:hypothetical protein
MRGWSIRAALVLCAVLSSPAKAERLDWHSEELRKNTIFCAALFRVRFDWMVEFQMEPTASMRELEASEKLQEIYGQYVSSFGFGLSIDPDKRKVDPDEGKGPPVTRGPVSIEPADLGPYVYWGRQKLLKILTESGARQHRPPICLEDETCSSCWDLLRLMQTQD